MNGYANGYARPRPHPLKPIADFVWRVAFFAGFVLGILLGIMALAGMAFAGL